MFHTRRAFLIFTPSLTLIGTWSSGLGVFKNQWSPQHQRYCCYKSHVACTTKAWEMVCIWWVFSNPCCALRNFSQVSRMEGGKVPWPQGFWDILNIGLHHLKNKLFQMLPSTTGTYWPRTWMDMDQFHLEFGRWPIGLLVALITGKICWNIVYMYILLYIHIQKSSSSLESFGMFSRQTLSKSLSNVNSCWAMNSDHVLGGIWMVAACWTPGQSVANKTTLPHHHPRQARDRASACAYSGTTRTSHQPHCECSNSWALTENWNLVKSQFLHFKTVMLTPNPLWSASLSKSCQGPPMGSHTDLRGGNMLGTRQCALGNPSGSEDAPQVIKVPVPGHPHVAAWCIASAGRQVWDSVRKGTGWGCNLP